MAFEIMCNFVGNLSTESRHDPKHVYVVNLIEELCGPHIVLRFYLGFGSWLINFYAGFRSGGNLDADSTKQNCGRHLFQENNVHLGAPFWLMRRSGHG